MAIPRFNEDLAIISKLGDNPGSDNNLTTDAFRAKFDEGPQKIQKFLNDVLIPAAEQSSSPQEGLSMQGGINMNGQKLNGLNAPVADDEAANMGYVKRAYPRNLLDNSDFTNPVNQRGKTIYTVVDYSIDRWFLPIGSDISLTSGGIKIVGMQNQYGSQLWQRIPYYENGKMYTFAVCDSDGEITIVSDVFNGNAVSKSTPWGSIGFDINSGYLTVQIAVNASYTKTFWWAALYEGEYTAETLPEYHPKGHGVELAECLRYFYRNPEPIRFSKGPGNSLVANVFYPTKMRVIPSLRAGTEGVAYDQMSDVGFSCFYPGSDEAIEWLDASAEL